MHVLSVYSVFDSTQWHSAAISSGLICEELWGRRLKYKSFLELQGAAT